MVIKYNKLVRDRIPEIIEKDGKTCNTAILTDEEYIFMLNAKLDEELSEYHKDDNVEELADLMEVIYAIAKVKGCSESDLDNIRKEKALQRGAFNDKILLIEVND